MQFYMEGQIPLIIDTMRGILTTKNIDPNLKVHCWYWIGYEQNNIGQFGNAEESFSTAIEESEGRRKLMLERLRVETMLFNAKKYKAIDLVDDIDRVLSDPDLEDCTDDERDLLALTKSNIFYAAAMDAYSKGSGDKAAARAHMLAVIDVLEPLVQRKIPVAEREYAFACIAVQKNVEEAKLLLDTSVRKSARNGILERTGARHKAFNTAILVMVSSVLEKKEQLAAYDARTTQYIGDMREDMTVYSPISKRNITRDDFLEEVKTVKFRPA